MRDRADATQLAREHVAAVWLQLRGEAGKRQIASVARGRKLALTHNLGGAPGECVSFVSVVGSEPAA